MVALTAQSGQTVPGLPERQRWAVTVVLTVVWVKCLLGTIAKGIEHKTTSHTGAAVDSSKLFASPTVKGYLFWVHSSWLKKNHANVDLEYIALRILLSVCANARTTVAAYSNLHCRSLVSIVNILPGAYWVLTSGSCIVQATIKTSFRSYMYKTGGTKNRKLSKNLNWGFSIQLISVTRGCLWQFQNAGDFIYTTLRYRDRIYWWLQFSCCQSSMVQKH